MSHPSPILLLQLYAEVADSAAAEQLACRIRTTLDPYVTLLAQDIAPYWKMPAYYGIALRLQARQELHATFTALVALAPAGWTFIDSPPQREAIWNPAGTAVFLADQVRWAHLDIFYPPD